MSLLLKWAGGKTQLIPELDIEFPAQCGTYFEPFFGGGAVFWHLAGYRRFFRAELSDLNGELIDMYRQVRDNPAKVVEWIEELRGACSTREGYNALREFTSESPPFLAARTICLNHAGFNGLYRQNRAGQFNTPWGKRALTFDTARVMQASALLSGRTNFAYTDFAECTANAQPGDLVYLDPPYAPLLGKNNFRQYTADGFTWDDQVRVRDEVVRLRKAGVHVVASNADTPEIRALYAGLPMRSVPARRAINRDGAKRGPVAELIIAGQESPANCGCPACKPCYKSSRYETPHPAQA